MPTFHLLTMSNPKALKGEAQGFMTFVLHLAPADLSGYNVCPMASLGCKASCLNTAGRGGMFKAGATTNQVQEARKRKTRMFFEARNYFMALLIEDIRKAIRFADENDMTPVFRLNATSDIRWETVEVEDDGFLYPNVMTLFPSVGFYDYTKIPNRRDIPFNYHLTFSLSEANWTDAERMLTEGYNVAVVFKGALPDVFMGARVTNGDATDLRFLDAPQTIVGLTAKGRAKKDTSGFVQTGT